MGLRLFFFPNFPGAFIQGATFIPDSRVITFLVKVHIFSDSEGRLALVTQPMMQR